MNIDQLYEIQKAFDARLIKEKNLEGKDLLPDTVLGLLVEIGELANNWRGFKYWSNDKEPRTRIEHCLGCSGNESLTEECVLCGGENPLLVEYVDCLHMLLSIANILGLSGDDCFVSEDSLDGEISEVLIELIHSVGMIHYAAEPIQKRQEFRESMFLLANLGQQRLGFTWEQIEKAFVDKNTVNHSRLSTDY